MKKILLFTLLSLILLFSGCSFVKKKTGTAQNIGPVEGGVGVRPRQNAVGLANDAVGQPASPDQNEQQLPTSEVPVDNQLSAKGIERMTLPIYEGQPEKYLPELEAIDPKGLLLEEDPIMINVEGMPLSDFITYAIGNTLKATYFIDEAVKGMKTPVTLRMAKKMPAETAFEIVIDILRQHGLIVEQRGGCLNILNSKAKQDVPTYLRVGRVVPDTRERITQLVPIEHVKAGTIFGMIKTLKLDKNGARVTTYNRENALLLTGTTAYIKQAVSLIKMLDVPYLQEKRPFIMPLTYWQPDEFIKQMTVILTSMGYSISKNPKQPGILFVPIKVLNSVLVVSPDDKTMNVVMEWKEKLDTAESAGTKEKPYTYKPKYTRASDLVDSIMNLYGLAPRVKGKAPKTGKAQPINTGLKIAADDGRNLVVLIVTPSKYKSILSLLRELDTPPRQVLLEATVAEVTLKDDLQYGLEWFLENNYDGGPFSIQSLTGFGGSVGASGMALSYITDRGNFGMLMSAFANEDKIKILSRPKLMVLDNEQATINIGTDVPVITSETPDASVTVTGKDTSTNVTRTIQYRSTGLILDVTPTINTEELVTLAISISLDEAQSNAFGSIDNPMILTRSIRTIVAVSSGQSIMLGGLMRENHSTTVSKIPLLGDIPILGNLFKATSRSTDKTELIIMITPTILTNTDDATRLTNEIRKGLEMLK